MIPSKARTEIHNAICKNYAQVNDWFCQKSKLLEYPIYSSYDIRDADFKISNVDANIYPAGFNNICPTDKETAVNLFKKYINIHYGPQIKKILLITEEHTKNPYYVENVVTIKGLLEEGGYQVAAAFPKDLPAPLELTSVTGKKLIIESGYENSVFFREFNPDLVISNNDFSQSLAEWGAQSSKPVNPPRELGWYQREKSRYFENFNLLIGEFANIGGFDPFLFQVQTEKFAHFEINNEASLNQLADRVDSFLSTLQDTYKKNNVTMDPFCFVKNNAGTYGLGVVRVGSGQEVKEWTYNSRKKMKAAKGGREIQEVIIQEGIPSIISTDGATSEPVIYMVGAELAGGFMRTHAEKSSTESLNSPGAVYKKLCVTDLQDDRSSCPLENVYGWSAKIGLLAIGMEAQQMNVKFKDYKKSSCGSI